MFSQGKVKELQCIFQRININVLHSRREGNFKNLFNKKTCTLSNAIVKTNFTHRQQLKVVCNTQTCYHIAQR